MNIQSFTITQYQGAETPAYVAAYASDSFTYGTERVMSGDPNADFSSWYKRVGVTVAGGVITTNAFTGATALAPTIIDGEDTGAVYNFYLITASGKPLRLLYSNIRIDDSLTSPVTMATLEERSLMPAFSRPFHQYYDTVQTDRILGGSGYPRLIPAGGDEGQVLVKASGGDYDLEYADQTGGGGFSSGFLVPLQVSGDAPIFQ